MIKIATQAEALELYNRDDIIKRVGKKADCFIYQPFIAHHFGSKMLFVFWTCGDAIEVHIAQPKEYIRSSRLLCRQIISWLFQHGAKRVITTAPPGKIANLALKVGMKPYRTEPDLIYFEVTR